MPAVPENGSYVAYEPKRSGSVRMRRPMISAPLGEDVDLAVLLVHVDATMVHDWPLPFCGGDRGVLLWGSICHHVKREASRFIPSTLFGGSAAPLPEVCTRL